MKNLITTLTLLLFVNTITIAQANYNQTILINEAFSTNTALSPFDGDEITTLSISGHITMASDTSFIRIIVNDSLGYEYMVYEMYPMLSDTNDFDFDYECEETCFLNQFNPENLVIQIQNATLYIQNIAFSNLEYSESISLQQNAKKAKNNAKLAAVQEYIRQNNLIWIAGDTDFSNLSYASKAKIWGQNYKSFGYEFYSRGFYSIFGPTESGNVLNHDYVSNFDWRNRHGANLESSGYYDGDVNGTGWMTPVVCQGYGCWLNDEFLCNVPETDCNQMGGIYRTAGTCWIFGPTAYVEALTNLYYNEHIDIDLSEQYIACEEGTVNPWYVSAAWNYYVNDGVPDEECLHYSASLENCEEMCSNPSENVQINGYTSRYPNSHISTRQYLMEYGPVEASLMVMPWGIQTHSMSLVGWGVIDEDELSVIGVTDPITSDWYGYTYWIYKESSGPGVHHNGFKYMIHWDGDEPILHTVNFPITTTNRTNDDINCFDKDGDGYYFWGIGPKPSHCPPCPDRADGDDSNPGLGPLNTNGTCTIINTYTASFESDWDNWIQVNNDDKDWWRHTGPTPTYIQHNGLTGPSSAKDGDYYIYTESSCNGCYPLKDFVIESPSIDLSTHCEVQINFYYHLHAYLWGNPDEAKLELQISYDNGITWQPNFWHVQNDQGCEWHFVSLQLPLSVNKVRFIATTTYNEFSDIALDNITIGPSEFNSTPIVINTSHTLWNTDEIIDSDIVIESGSDLTIENCTIHMHNQSKIIVKQGGKLFINDAILTSKCELEQWQGIEVWGSTEQHQFFDGNNQYYQGYVYLDHAILENAVCALNLWKPNDYAKTGGMVFAYDCQFINNTQSLHACHYRNFHPVNGSEMDYQTIFKNCEFLLDGSYLGKNEFFKHVDISYLRGIKFYGCDFSLSHDALNVSWWNHGIAAYSAGFYVGPICLNQVEPCQLFDRSTFSGLRTGITVRNLNSIYTFTVKQCVFNNLVYGIDNYSANNAPILNNHFTIGSDYYSDECAFGIYQRLATGFGIENNTLVLFENSKCIDHYGIHTMNTNGVDEIYRNQYKNLKYANFAAGENRNPYSIATGLQYFCNKNDENYADFYIQDNDRSYISFFQGNMNKSTGNTFSRNGVIHIHNGNPNGYISYYYNSMDPTQIPDQTKVFGNVSLVPIIVSNPCIDHYGDIIKEEKLTEAEKTETELRYAEALSNLQNIATLYNTLIDGGSTEEKLIEISNATPNDAWEIRASLLGNSPHLSETVLKAMVDRTDVLSESAIFEILSANPDELRNEDLMVYLEEKGNPLPEYMMNILRQLSSGLSYRTTLEGEIALHDRERVRAAHDMLRSLLNEEQIDYITIRAWLDNLGGLSSDRQIISTYIQQNNYTDAIALANLLPTLYDFSEDEIQLHTDYMYLLNLQQQLYNEGRLLSQLSESEINIVNIISSTNEELAGAQAQGIMEAFYSEWTGNCPDVNDTVTWKNAKIDERLIAKAKGIAIAVNPNPASIYCSFKYKLPSKESSADLKIFDSKNMLLNTYTINGQEGELLWDTRSVNSGIYFYQFKVDKITLGGKIVVIK